MAKLPKISDVDCMSAGQINKALDRVDKAGRALVDDFIAAGRGHEKPSETRTKTDPLAQRHIQISDVRWTLRNEIERRYGPGAPSRLPTGRGFGPISARCRK